MPEISTKEQIRNQTNNILRLLSEKYPTRESIYEKLIYLQARLSLPKEGEHFMSDLHGEYNLFYHIINNCSGVIREKVDYLFGIRMTDEEKAEFCTLIYYPMEKLKQISAQGRNTSDWYRKTLFQLLELSKFMSYKYPSFKLRSFIPKRYDTIILELMNTHPEADEAQATYHKKLLDTIVEINASMDFILAFTAFIKRLAIGRLHIVGDFFDRGSRPDAILDRLMEHPSVDIQWGNHDALWMGAALGSEVCVAAVIRNSLRYNNTDVLERGYGISLRSLTTYASQIYPKEDPIRASEHVITMLMFKLEGQLIRRNPDFLMGERLLLDKVDFHTSSVTLPDGKNYPLEGFPASIIGKETKDPCQLTEKEQELIRDLASYFTESPALQRHLDYLYSKGGIYTCFNGNLLFHSSVPLNEDGSLREVSFGGKKYKGKAYFDYADHRARQAYLQRNQEGLDFMYFLWCGYLSPVAGREFRTFERAFIRDEKTWKEPSDPYFHLIDQEEICRQILKEFGLAPEHGHIINGHVPVRVRKGESPIKAGGKALVIDGGFSEAYHKKTGISGYTLISNSRGLRLLQHQKIANVRTALKENRDIESVSETVELQAYRTTVGDTDHGKGIQDEIENLHNILAAYQNGTIKPRNEEGGVNFL